MFDRVLNIPLLILLVCVTASKVSKYGAISGLYFPVFGLNTERYSVSLRIQSEYRKIQPRNNSVFGHLLRSVFCCKLTFTCSKSTTETLEKSVEYVQS